MSNTDPKSITVLPEKKKGVARLIAATRYSLAGLRAAFQHEEAFRFEVYVFCLLAPLALWLGESRTDKVLLICPLFLVIVAELLNSAIEAVVDRSGSEYHALAGRAKDMGSAAVFCCMVLTVFVWGMLLL
jgi:diacylglycerol kinase (ATP)